MQLDLTSEEIMIRDTMRKIAREKIAPHAEKLDKGEGRDILLNNLKLLADNGLACLNIPTEYGGSQTGAVGYALAIEELGYACAATTVTMCVTNMVAKVINAGGSEAQKKKYIGGLADGSLLFGAFCLTESNAGSDPAGMQTTAHREGEAYILNGEKIYISMAAIASFFVVWAVTDKAAPKGKGISLFIIDAETKGIVIGPAEHKMGQNGSTIHTVTFTNVRVPVSALMGKENDGFRIAAGELAAGRIGIAAMSLGIARAAFDYSLAHAKERRQFNSRIADFQGIQWLMADRATEMEAARLLILQAAHLQDEGKPFMQAASMAKLYASETCGRVTDVALQLCGGAGYIKPNPCERYVRDARVTRIYEGTSEVQRMVIAREIIRQ